MPNDPYNQQPNRVPRLSDPDNIDSDVTPADLKNQPGPQKESDEEVVKLVRKRFKLAQQAKRKHEQEWLLDMAFERGNQWVEWRDDILESLIDPNDPYRSYMKCNLILPLTVKIKARATQTKPDASIQPLTDSEVDQMAAAEARDGIEHYENLLHDQQLLNEWVDSCLSSSTSFMKCVWNPRKKALVPFIDPETGQQGPARMLPVGDIEKVIVPPTEAFPDPHARRWSEVEWFIHAKERTLSYIQEKFPKDGYRVNGNVGGADNNYIQARIDSMVGDDGHWGDGAPAKVVELLEMWELPSARYPKGRVCWVAGDVLLYAGDWPYKKNDTFPFVPLTYRIKGGSIWSLNAVHDLVPLQRQYNNVLSRINDHINTYKNTILTPEGFEGGVDAFQSERSFNRLTYKIGHEPHYFPSPAVPAEWFTALQVIKSQMEDISGVHEVSSGQRPEGVDSGVAIELLQQSDTTQMSEFLQAIETAMVETAEWTIQHMAQFFREERLIGISSTGNGPMPPQGPQGPDQGPPGAMGGAMVPAQPPPPSPVMMKARAFKALTAGGQCRVTIIPGSMIPSTPAARSAKIMDMAKSGMFKPEALPMTKIVVDLMGLDKSDKLRDRIDALIREQQANQPSPAALEQMKIQEAQKAQKLQLDHAAELQAIKDHGEADILTVKHQHEAEIKGLDHQHAVELAQVQSQLRMAEAEHERSLPAKLADGTWSLDPSATVEQEENVGLDNGKVPPVPKPAAGAPAKKASSK